MGAGEEVCGSCHPCAQWARSWVSWQGWQVRRKLGCEVGEVKGKLKCKQPGNPEKKLELVSISYYLYP